MNEVWVYSLISVVFVSLISFIGIISLSVKLSTLKKFLIYMVAFSAGALFGGAFLHLLPEMIGEFGFNLTLSLWILAGILLFFVVEKFIFWHHCHELNCKHVKSFAIMNLVGDGVHNFLDGMIIAGSYLVSIPVGIATTIAVIFHEIPQEIGDFGVLVHGGFSRGKALVWNFLSGLVAVVGAVVVLLLGQVINGIEMYLVPIAIGGFIYIAGSDLIPELHKEQKFSKSFWQLFWFILGILIMRIFLFLE